MRVVTFKIMHPGELSAGIRPYTEMVKIYVRHDPGGEEGEFEEFMKSTLSDWFEGAVVTREEE